MHFTAFFAYSLRICLTLILYSFAFAVQATWYPADVIADGKKQYDPLTGAPITHEACDQLTIVPNTGTQSQAEFDETIKNLVSFLDYSANPIKLESQRIGIYVLLYLAFFFVFAYLLKREYWKDVH